jgi:hypothetical protein
MPNYIYDDTAIPFPKADLAGVPAGADPTKYVDADDWNAVCQALDDVKTVLRDGNAVHVEGTTSYQMLETDRYIRMTQNSSTLTLVAAPLDGKPARIKNASGNALTVAAGAGDTTDVTSIASGAIKELIYRAATKVWEDWTL